MWSFIGLGLGRLCLSVVEWESHVSVCVLLIFIIVTRLGWTGRDDHTHLRESWLTVVNCKLSSYRASLWFDLLYTHPTLTRGVTLMSPKLVSYPPLLVLRSSTRSSLSQRWSSWGWGASKVRLRTGSTNLGGGDTSLFRWGRCGWSNPGSRSDQGPPTLARPCWELMGLIDQKITSLFSSVCFKLNWSLKKKKKACRYIYSWDVIS